MTGLQLISKSVLSKDAIREHRINCNSFQQEAIISYNGWQYACFYSMIDDGAQPGQYGVSPLLVNISRRHESDLGAWERLTFTDYVQVVDDAHNTISMGICPGDGSIHVSFDHHCDLLRLRISLPGVASKPAAHKWTAALFGPVRSKPPGSAIVPSIFSEISYPRFLAVRSGLLFSFRIGRAGSGSEVLFKYAPLTGEYDYVCEPLTGLQSSPYINGLSYSRGLVHVSGCYRGFFYYEGVNDQASTAHKTNAGPNGPENNYGLVYIYSSDDGQTWKNTYGTTVASEASGKSVTPKTEGVMICDIPRGSGIMNQEGQACDDLGGFHVLNRENEVWYHYYRSPAGRWTKYPIQDFRPTRTGSRGTIIAVGRVVYLALPGNSDRSLTILTCNISEHAIGPHQVAWTGEGFDGEPHLSTLRKGDALILSVYTTTVAAPREVVVLDLGKADD